MPKPYIICHMVTTLDGKILTHRWGKVPGVTSGAGLFERTHDTFNIPAWIVGNTTMKEFQGKPQKLGPAPRGFKRGDHIAQQKPKSFAIGCDAKAVLRFQEGETEGDHVVLLLTEKAGNAYLAHLQKAGVSYLMCGKTQIDLKLALEKISKYFGLKKLMCEGGGAFNGSMIQAGLIDEVSHLTIPVIDGGRGVAGFFDIPGDTPPMAAAQLKLKNTTTLPGGVIWSRYKVIGPASK